MLERVLERGRAVLVPLLLSACSSGGSSRFIAPPEVPEAQSVIVAIDDGTGFELHARSLTEDAARPLLEMEVENESELRIVLVYFREDLAETATPPRPPLLEAYEAHVSRERTETWQPLLTLPADLTELLFPDLALDCDGIVASTVQYRTDPGPAVEVVAHLPDGRLLVGGVDETGERAVLGFFTPDEGRGLLETWSPGAEFRGIRQLAFDDDAAVYGFDAAAGLFRTDTNGQVAWTRASPTPLALRNGAGRVVAFAKTSSGATTWWELSSTSTIPIQRPPAPAPILDLALLDRDRSSMVSIAGDVYVFDGSRWSLELPVGEGVPPTAVFGSASLEAAIGPGSFYLSRDGQAWEEREDPLIGDVGPERAGAVLAPDAYALFGRTQVYVRTKDAWCLVLSTLNSHDAFDVDQTRRSVVVTIGRSAGSQVLRFRY